MGRTADDMIAAVPKESPERVTARYQADMYLSTLRSSVKAIDGELELVVRLPSQPALHLHHLGDLLSDPVATRPSRSRRTPGRA